MKKENFNSKRFLFVGLSFLVLGFMGVWAVINGQEGIGATVAVSLAGVVTWYLEKETKRPSGSDK